MTKALASENTQIKGSLMFLSINKINIRLFAELLLNW